MRKIALYLCLALTVCVAAQTSHASLLNLSRTTPDVFSDFASLSYNPNGGGAGIGLLTVSGWSESVDRGSGPDSFISGAGNFELTAKIAPSTGQFISGSLSITGDDNNDGLCETLLQSVRMVAFGSGVDDKFEFLFIQDSGTLALPGTVIGIIMDGRTITQGGHAVQNPVFTASFSGDGLAVCDSFVPEPATMGLLILGGLGMISRRSRAARQ